MCHHRTSEYVNAYENVETPADTPEWALDDEADVEDREEVPAPGAAD